MLSWSLDPTTYSGLMRANQDEIYCKKYAIEKAFILSQQFFTGINNKIKHCTTCEKIATQIFQLDLAFNNSSCYTTKHLWKFWFVVLYLKCIGSCEQDWLMELHSFKVNSCYGRTSKLEWFWKAKKFKTEAWNSSRVKLKMTMRCQKLHPSLVWSHYQRAS